MPAMAFQRHGTLTLTEADVLEAMRCLQPHQDELTTNLSVPGESE